MNCKPGDLARFVAIGGSNDGRMVMVERAALETDRHEGRADWGKSPCWVVVPLQPLWVHSAAFMPYTTVDRCVVPDAHLLPIRGLPADGNDRLDIDLGELSGAEVLTVGAGA